MTTSLKQLPGTLTYNTGSNTLTGTSTLFDSYFSNGDVISLQANTSNSATIELAIIRTVNSPTSITLYGPPNNNSTASAIYKASPIILQSQLAYYEGVMNRTDGQTTGVNENILALASVGNSVVSTTTVLNSGKGYVDNEVVYAYPFGLISNTTNIINPGTGYSSSDKVIFSGGDPAKTATGTISVNSSGSVTSLNITSQGSGYQDIPVVRIQSNTGSGAVFGLSLQELDNSIQVTGKVVKSGVGKTKGFWTTTRGFLDSDKYIQDSYYYQDYSYEIRVALALQTYKNILYDTFHTAGSELFGRFTSINIESSLASILNEPITLFKRYTADSTFITADSSITVDSQAFELYLVADMTTLTADSATNIASISIIS